MRHKKNIAFSLFLYICISCSQKEKQSLRILLIGDSNTEAGNITMPLKKLLDSAYGDHGTGYCTLNPNSMGQVPDSLSVQCDSNWAMFDMRNDFKPEQPPYYSPDGLSISSSKHGAIVKVNFSGKGIDLYYLTHPAGGNFSVVIDGIEKGIFSQNDRVYKTGKMSFKNLTHDKHLLSVKVIAGAVTFLGIDVKRTNVENKRRFILHKWSNAWASTNDYLNINREVFSSALQELDPNRIVILLGTNDHNLDHRNPDTFKSNLKELVRRIKNALPATEILIVSTFTTDSDESRNILPLYISKSFPEAAGETNSSYWNMNAWFGPYDPQKLPDGVHVNEIYGKLIAAELFKRLK